MSEDIFDAIIAVQGLPVRLPHWCSPAKVRKVSYRARQFRWCQERHRRASLAHSLEHIIPGFADSAPVERRSPMKNLRL